MLPVLTIVGRPNVGKSTLFNRLTKTRDALVADFPGLTRDRQYGIGRIGPRPYVIVDTGGLSSAAEGLEALMERQVQIAIAEADHLLFMVDARDGCTPEDLELAARLRRTGKPLALAVNKSDQFEASTATAEFHALGLGDPVAISATQGRGVAALIDAICDQWSAPEPTLSEASDGLARIAVAVVGRPNAGKSTLINRLLGEERLVACDQPGTTRDSIAVPFERPGGGAYTLVDTAGLRRRSRVHETIEKFSIIKTLQSIEAAHAVILVLDAQVGIGEQDATLAAHIVEAGRALVIAINKWDGLPQDQRERIQNERERKLAFLEFARTFTISARHGTGVGLLLDAVDAAHANATRNLPTPELNRLLAALVAEHPPPLVHGRRIKLRYAHQGGRNPPIIVIHGNQTDSVPDSYRRYLLNRFRRELKLQGTPLRLEFKSGENPFEGRRNPLTPRQIRHRQRLRDFTARRR